MEQIRTLGDVFGVIKRRFFIMAFIVIMGTLGAIYYALQQPRLYETHAALQIESAAVQATSPSQRPGTSSAAHRLTLIEQRLMARDSLTRVITKLGLFADTPFMPLNEKITALRRAVSLVQIKDGAQSWQPNVTPSGLLITVRYGDPRLAAAIANEFLGSVLEENRKRRTERTQGALDFFRSEETRLGDVILSIEAEIAAFKIENAGALPDDIATQRAQLVALLDTELALDRDILAITSDTARQRQSVVEEQLTRLEDQRQLLRVRIDEIEGILARAPDVERALSALTRKLAQMQNQFSVITNGRAEAEMGQQLAMQDQTERLIVLETALVPEHPIAPSRKRIALLGFLASGLLACAVALTLEMANPAIRTAAHLERQLGIQPVVSIPYVSNARDTRRGRLRWVLVLIGAAGGAFFLLRDRVAGALGSVFSSIAGRRETQ